MKVLIVHSKYRHEGGEERAVQLEQEALQEAQISNHLLLAEHQDTANLSFVEKAALAKGVFHSSESIKKFQTTLETFNPDIVHFHNIMPLWGYGVLDRALHWALRKGRKVFSTIHNQRWICANGLFWRGNTACYQCLDSNNPLWGAIHNCRDQQLESVTYATAISYAWAKGLYNHPSHELIALNGLTQERLKNAFPSSQVHLLPNPVVIPQKPASLNLPKWSGTRIAVIGRLSHEKGIYELINLIRFGKLQDGSVPSHLSLPSTQFVVAGDGPLKDLIQEEAKQNERILYLGKISEAQVTDALKQCDAYLFSSLVEEQCPTVLRQALLLKKQIYTLSGKARPQDFERWGPLFNVSDWSSQLLELFNR